MKLIDFKNQKIRQTYEKIRNSLHWKFNNNRHQSYIDKGKEHMEMHVLRFVITFNIAFMEFLLDDIFISPMCLLNFKQHRWSHL